MPKFAAAVNEFAVVEANGKYVIAVFDVTTNGQKLSYVATFGQDVDGTWRLFSM